MARHIAPAERETHITICDGYKRATVYSEQRSYVSLIRRLAKRHPTLVQIHRDGKHGATPYIEADMPVSFVGLRSSKTLPEGSVNGNPSPTNSGTDVIE